jgi:uncharacterized membrane protein
MRRDFSLSIFTSLCARAVLTQHRILRGKELRHPRQRRDAMSLDQDLRAVLLATGAAAALTAVPGGFVRVAAALLLGAFLPGYALLAALYPGRTDFSALERLTLSAVVSFTLVIIVGLVLSATPWGLALGPVALSLVGLILAGTAAAALRRRRLPGADRFAPVLGTANVVAVVCLLLLVIGVGFGVAAIDAEHGVATQFYLLGPHGTLADYPTRSVVGRPVEVTVGISNRERRAESYRLIVTNGRTVLGTYDVTAGPRASTERRIAFKITRPGRVDVTFLLYRRGGREVRQFLRLPLTVSP